MPLVQTLRAGCAGMSLLTFGAIAQQPLPPEPAEARPAAELAAELRQLKQELAEQRAMLQQLRAELGAQRQGAGAVAQAPSTQWLEPLPAEQARQRPVQRPLAAATLEGLRGAGGAGAASGAMQSQPQPPLQVPGQGPAAPQAPGPQAPAAPAVGQAPARDSRPPEVAPLFEAPGVLTQRGHYVLEPSFQFGYSSSNRVALVGYTIIPALLIGLVDVREVKRNTFTAAISGRYGLTNRTELELRVPYVYRSDSTVSRELFTGTAVERVFETRGKAIGDIELSLRHQLNDGGADKAYYIAGLRVKTRTGRDPFEVVTDCTQRCVGENATGTGLPLDLPTGSGFYGIQPSLTWLFPSDPAIFFGSISYLHNVKRSNVMRMVLNGEVEPLGEVKPGGVIGFNFGIGLALNDKASLSLGYDHSSMGRTRQNGVNVPGSVRTQLGTLLMGFSYRLNEKRTVNVTVGAGLTQDTPDVSLSVRLPLAF
ncbi:acetate kinase [Pseudoduganella umbonata]|nr:acetate kinase [Pseudoduganella umbonata]MBB3221169.1 hypothetical protein [Pseudoduganella umbonata]